MYGCSYVANGHSVVHTPTLGSFDSSSKLSTEQGGVIPVDKMLIQTINHQDSAGNAFIRII